MEYDFAIIYFGLTRSLKKTHESHKTYIFDILNSANLIYQTFMHTWKTKDDSQNIWENVIPEKIDYLDHTLLPLDYYKLDDEDIFLESVNMDNYFYKDVWEKEPDSEWLPKLISNYVCMLESQKRGFDMVKESILKGNKFKFIMFIRPDILIYNEIPINVIINNYDKIQIPNHSHFEGFNDQVAILNYENACIHGKRIEELAEFRKTQGRIVAEKYCKFIINKYNMEINELDFQYAITRP